MESSFSQNFGNGTDTSIPYNVFFVFLVHFGHRQAAHFTSFRYTC